MYKLCCDQGIIACGTRRNADFGKMIDPGNEAQEIEVFCRFTLSRLPGESIRLEYKYYTSVLNTL
jgi:hypothetical protein